MSQSSRWKSQGGMNRRPTNNIVTNNNSHSNILNARILGTEYTTIDKRADLRDMETSALYSFDNDKNNFANVISYYPFNDLSYNTPLPSETTNTDISNQSLATNLSAPKPFTLVFKDPPSNSGTFYKPKVAYNDLISQNVIQLDPSSQVLATDLSFNTTNAFDASGSTISAALTMSCFVYIPDSDVSTTAGQSNQFCLFAIDDLSQNALQNFTFTGGIVDGSDNLLYLWYPNKNGKAQLLYGYKSQNAAQSWSYINKESEKVPTDKWTHVVLVLAGLSIYVIVDGTVVISSSGSEIQGASYVPDQPFNINLGPYYYDSVNAVSANLTTTNTATPLLSDCKIANWAVGQQLAAAVASPGGYGHQYSVTSKPNKQGLLYYLLSKDLISFSTPTLFRSDLNLGGNLQSYGTNNFYGQSNFYTKTYFADGIITDGSSSVVVTNETGNFNIFSQTLGTTNKNASLFITNSSEIGGNPYMASMLVFNDNDDIYNNVQKSNLPAYVDKLQFSISGENVSVGHGFGDSSFNVFGDSVMDGSLSLINNGVLNVTGPIEANGGINTTVINSNIINVFDKLDVSGVDISNNLTVDGKIDMSRGVALNGQYGTTTLPIGASSPSDIYNTQQLIHFITDPTENPSNDWAMFSSESSGSDRGIFVLTVGDNSYSQNDKFIIRGNNITGSGSATWNNKDLAYFSSQNGVVLTNTTIYGQLDVSGTGINFTNGYIGISQDTVFGPIRIGNAAGETTQGNYSVAIGNNAGKTGQSNNSVALGDTAGFQSQGQYSIALGQNAASYNQDQYSVAIGYQAGQTDQSNNSVAIGLNTGQTTQGESSVAIGNGAGGTNQGPYSIAMGYGAGNQNQGQSSVAIGYQAGQSSLGVNSVAIGPNTVCTDASSVALGSGATTTANNQIVLGTATETVKIPGDLDVTGDLDVSGNVTGNVTGNITGNADTATKISSITNTNIVQLDETQTLTNKTLTSPTITGNITGDTGNFTGVVSAATPGAGAPVTNLATLDWVNSYASSGGGGWTSASGSPNTLTSTANTKVVISGSGSGSLDVSGNLSFTNGYIGISQDASGGPIRIGYEAGQTNQQDYCVAIGSEAGNIRQGTESVAIGHRAGIQDQSNNSIAIGFNAGNNTQGESSVAIGHRAAQNNQGAYSVAIGPNTVCQNSSSVALGSGATTTANNQIVLGTATETVKIPGQLDVSGNLTVSNPTSNSALINVIGPGVGGTYVMYGLDTFSAPSRSGPAVQIRATDTGSYAANLSFWTAENGDDPLADATQRMTITTSGNVGIGTDTPSYTLDVSGNTYVSGTATISKYFLSGGQSNLLTSEAFSQGTIINWNNSDGDGETDFINSKGTGVGGFNFYNIDSGSTILSSNPNPLMTISSSGNVTATAFNTTSDVRLKENITNLDNSLDKICNIRGVNYNWKNDETKTKTAGIIAQEVLEQIPEAVIDSDSEKLSVNYNSIIAYLIESVKELKREIDELKAK